MKKRYIIIITALILGAFCAAGCSQTGNDIEANTVSSPLSIKNQDDTVNKEETRNSKEETESSTNEVISKSSHISEQTLNDESSALFEQTFNNESDYENNGSYEESKEISEYEQSDYFVKIPKLTKEEIQKSNEAFERNISKYKESVEKEYDNDERRKNTKMSSISGYLHDVIDEYPNLSDEQYIRLCDLRMEADILGGQYKFQEAVIAGLATESDHKLTLEEAKKIIEDAKTQTNLPTEDYIVSEFKKLQKYPDLQDERGYPAWEFWLGENDRNSAYEKVILVYHGLANHYYVISVKLNENQEVIEKDNLYYFSNAVE